MQKVTRIRNRKHLDWLKTLPCVKCWCKPCDPAHIRIGTNGGTGLKPGDNFAIPLCRTCHSVQHQGERSFWGDKLENAIKLANALSIKSGDDEMAVTLINRFNR